MRFNTLTTLAALVVSTAAVPAPAAEAYHVLHEKRDTIPVAWVKRDSLPAGISLPVRIGLTQSNIDQGPDLLMEVLVLSWSFISVGSCDFEAALRSIIG